MSDTDPLQKALDALKQNVFDQADVSARRGPNAADNLAAKSEAIRKCAREWDAVPTLPASERKAGFEATLKRLHELGIFPDNSLIEAVVTALKK
jgi:hypothetical protein